MLAHVLEGLSADAWRRRNGCGAVVISLAQTGYVGVGVGVGVGV